MMDALSTASGVEWVQVSAALAGTILSLWALFDASKDAIALADSGSNGPRQLIAVGNLRRESVRLVINLTFVVVGIASLFLPPPHTAADMPHDELLQLIISRMGLTVVSVATAIDGLWDRHHRRQFVRALRWNGTAFSLTEASPPMSEQDRRH
jgi:hypothetical protein